MAPGWMDQIPNYAICNFFYAFYVVYAVIFALSVLHIVYIFAVVKKFDLSHGIMLGSGFFTMALALVLTLFHYLVCDRALIHKTVKDVEGFVGGKGKTSKAAAGATAAATGSNAGSVAKAK
jgi:uncharacterized membrane protein YcgQ (UPF0703/DUF1980 family)